MSTCTPLHPGGIISRLIDADVDSIVAGSENEEQEEEEEEEEAAASPIQFAAAAAAAAVMDEMDVDEFSPSTPVEREPADFEVEDSLSEDDVVRRCRLTSG